MDTEKELRIAELKRKLSLHAKLEPYQITIAGRAFELFLIGNIDELLENLIARDPEDEAVKDEQIPYWADLWPAAIGLAEYMLTSPDLKPGMRVLEVGCGMALSGIAAAARVPDVTVTDYLSEALEIAELHWLMNLESQPDCRKLDWREPTPEFMADIILASDVAYEKRNTPPLLHTFKTLLKPGGEVWLSEPGRSVTQELLALLPEHGFQDRIDYVPVEFWNKKWNIAIHRISRKS